mmetsp:Transcript_95309/g.246322  ORF Transcript_95309/g.246322 Transcript_95309/m.246322 type:complete len:394 (+) Transcript_95309:856-2037(+)
MGDHDGIRELHRLQPQDRPAHGWLPGPALLDVRAERLGARRLHHVRQLLPQVRVQGVHSGRRPVAAARRQGAEAAAADDAGEVRDPDPHADAAVLEHRGSRAHLRLRRPDLQHVHAEGAGRRAERAHEGRRGGLQREGRALHRPHRHLHDDERAAELQHRRGDPAPVQPHGLHAVPVAAAAGHGLLRQRDVGPPHVAPHERPHAGHQPDPHARQQHPRQHRHPGHGSGRLPQHLLAPDGVGLRLPRARGVHQWPVQPLGSGQAGAALHIHRRRQLLRHAGPGQHPDRDVLGCGEVRTGPARQAPQGHAEQRAGGCPRPGWQRLHVERAAAGRLGPGALLRRTPLAGEERLRGWLHLDLHLALEPSQQRLPEPEPEHQRAGQVHERRAAGLRDH